MDEGGSRRTRATRKSGRRTRPPIAIIGFSGRYPGSANNPAQLWLNLKQGRDGISERLGERWDPGYFNPDPKQLGRIYTRCAGLLDQIDLFDADFFGISPREAIYIDPQQRLLLELAWEALEDAALVPKQLAGAMVGVFVGIAAHDYADLQSNMPKAHGSAYVNSGGALSIAANRISYTFDFRGPSFAVDTACSSALVAIHNACLSLWSGECSTALAGGVNLLANPEPSIGFCNASMLSRSGRCHSFDAGADGYVRSEGGGIVVLKPLDAAERDGDPIHALIVGSGVNSDGHTQGLSMPNEFAQEALLRQVYAESGIAPDDVVYVESHGTGTPVGDPIECNAVGRVLGVPRRDGRPCLIGSIKSNIGHLETASGVAGLTKVLLALRHRELPANLHFNTPNPKIAFDELNLKVVDRAIRLPRRGKPLVMGVSSYGFGGTNAHIAVREYRRPADHAFVALPASRGTASDRVLLLSARSGDALAAMATDYAALLRTADADDLDAICATAALCRARHPHRLAASGAQATELAMRLERFAAGEPAARLASARVVAEAPRLAFAFSGNGPQWWGMGRELLAASSLFRAEVERVDVIFKRLAGWSLIDEMTLPEAASRMDKTEVAQPALFALQLGLVRVLDEAGVRPAAVVGHSVGEVAAAYVSGALTLDEAVSVIYERSRAQALTAGLGKMAAIGLGREAAETAIAAITGWLEIAAVNSGRSVTVVGAPEALETLGRKMTEAGIFNRVLALDYPFHSRAMDAIEAPLRTALAGLRPRPALLPFVSAVEGREIGGERLDASYWWRNIREPVRFEAAVDHLLMSAGATVFLELGPHPVLRDYVLQCAKDRDAAATVIPTLRRPSATRAEPELDNLWGAICACHANGVTDPGELFERPAVPAALPFYPWQRQSFWSGVVPLPDMPTYSHRDHPLLGYRIAAGDALWENRLDTTLLPYLVDHVVQGAVVFPATAFIEMVLAGAARIFGPVPCDIEDLDIRKALVIPHGEMPILQIALSEEDGSFRIRSRLNAEVPTWTAFVAGKVARAPGAATAHSFALAELRGRMGTVISKDAHYRVCSGVGLSYGPTFQALEAVYLGDDEALGKIGAPAAIAGDLSSYCVHPCLFDASLQALGHFDPGVARAGSAYLPVQLRRLRTYATGTTPQYCYVRVTRRSARSVLADIRLLDGDGRVILEIEDLRFVGVDFTRDTAVPVYAHAWQLAERGASRAAPSLPSPSLLAERLRPKIQALTAQFERAEYYEEIEPLFDRLAAAWAVRALASLGAREAPFSLAGLMARGQVLEEHRRYLEQLIVIAEADGLIDTSPDGWIMPEDRELPDPTVLWRELFYAQPAFLAELSLFARCGERIAAVLRGERDASEILSPDTGSGALDHLYDTAPSFRIYHHIARAIVAELLRERSTEHRLRILEIGGGTGGLTAHLLPLLPPAGTDYVFTDVSARSLARAEHRFGAYRFIRFGELDIGRDPVEQALPAGGFDLVVCADALHFAADLHQALRHVRTLLAPGGQLLLIEKHAGRFVDLAFGLAKEWWKFADSDLRRNSPLLPPDMWRHVLAEAGFAETASFSDAEAVPAGFIQGSPQHTIFLSQLPPAAAGADTSPTLARGEQSWLLLADAQGAAGDLARSTAALLRQAGHRVVVAQLGDGFVQAAADRFIVAPDAADDFVRLVAALDAAGHGCDQIVHLAGMTPLAERSAAALSTLQDVRCLSTILLVQALKNAGVAWTPRLTLVTSRAVAPPSGAGAGDPGQAPLWGLGRVLANEHPGLGCRLVDLQLDLADPGAPRLLAAELVQPSDESEVLLDGDARYVARLRATSAAEQASLARHRTPLQNSAAPDRAAQPFRLDFSAHGLLGNLYIAATERRPPRPGEVEIRVRAAGLNFRDVMWVMGMLPEEALENGFAGPTIGMECSGEIVALGEGVTEFTVGERVIAFAPDCFASYVNTPASAVSPMPKRLGFEAAATIPSVFFTAYYALHHLARLDAGESVLIHGAAGGVGLAAIQIAKWLGAKIFGTAGSAEKRDILHSLGVDHVLDSRSLDFADEVMRLTAGRGVDVVLNSLAGEAIAKNLQILKPFGRFLEIGKRDLYANSKIGLRPFRNNLSYFGIDADSLMSERSALAQRLLREIVALFESGELHPLPYHSFPVSRAGDAFRQMQQSRHIGKLVIAMDDDEPGNLPIVARAAPVRGDATYLVTGGLSGFGLATARWLVDKGARHLALIGRRGAATEDAQSGIAALEAAGAAVRIFATDVADEAAFAETMTQIRRDMPALRGIIHAAMVLDDCVLQHLDRERLHRVLAPKMLGAWNLHRATLDQPLDFFVLYSSVASVIGNAGQANYAAANLYLEALAEYRRGRGLPALAIEWGPLTEVGYLARNVEISELMRSRAGLEGISPRQALAELDRLLAAGATSACVAQLDWQRLAQLAPSATLPKFSLLVNATGAAGTGGSVEELRASLAALPFAEQKDYVIKRLKDHFARVLGTTAAQIDADRPLSEMGLDSLMAVELGEVIERDLKIALPVLELIQSGTISAMAARILKLVGMPSELAAVPASVAAAPADA